MAMQKSTMRETKTMLIDPMITASTKMKKNCIKKAKFLKEKVTILPFKSVAQLRPYHIHHWDSIIPLIGALRLSDLHFCEIHQNQKTKWQWKLGFFPNQRDSAGKFKCFCRSHRSRLQWFWHRNRHRLFWKRTTLVSNMFASCHVIFMEYFFSCNVLVIRIA